MFKALQALFPSQPRSPLGAVYHHSIEEVRANFQVVTRGHPYRCTFCRLMQPIGADLVWVSESAAFHKQEETFQSLVNGGKASHRTGACMDCVRCYK